MNFEKTAKAFKEIGHPVRLKIVQRLIKAGMSGIPVGALQEETQIPHSTLSHHISSLISAELMTQRREGRTLYCILNYENIEYLKVFLAKDCCIDEQD